MPMPNMSDAEWRVVREIRALRAEPRSMTSVELLQDHVSLTSHLIVLAHGSTKLRFEKLADELGVELRTLERTFKLRFGTNMKSFASETRLKFAQHILASDPLHKISAIASLLDYTSHQAFIRFFRKRTGTTPALWAYRQQLAQGGIDSEPASDDDQ
jgi:AraC-like DNA-binding protein